MIEIEIKKYRKFCNRNDNNFPARCRIQGKHINTLIKRNKWLRIENNENGYKKVVYRQVQGTPSREGCQIGFTKDAVEFDYDTSVELGLKKNIKIDEESKFRECNLIARPATFIECFFANFSHPDYGYNIGFKLGLVSVVLGIIGIII